MVKHRLVTWAREHGHHVAWGGVAILTDIRTMFEEWRATGVLDATFYHDRLSDFQYAENHRLPDPKSILVIAVPRPAHKLVFELGQGRIETVIPPTYQAYHEVSDGIQRELAAAVLGDSGHIERLTAPLKTIAARLGLIAYGRNNIAYIPGMGSYFQLLGYVTNLVLESSVKPHPAESMVLADCSACGICLATCPTGAIAEDRFLLHAERCLTFLNESTNPFPGDISPSTHHCLIGCMRCQENCPQNDGLLRFETLAETFTPEETTRFLTDGIDRSHPLWQAILAKLKRIGMLDDEAVLGRNLQALLARPQADSLHGR